MIDKVNVFYSEKNIETEESLLESINDFKENLHHIVLKNEDIDKQEFLNEIQQIVVQSKNLYIFHMLKLMREYNDETYIHCINVGLICNMMGRWLNFPKKEVEILTLCGLLHDIGKVRVPQEIVKKPTGLSQLEFEAVKMHPSLGLEILKDKHLDRRIIQAVYEHHERCDGTGYPRGLKGDEINDLSKIVTIADVYDAMTSKRVYREAMCPFDVIEELLAEGSMKYDPEYLINFLQNVVELYVNKTVRLNNNKEGCIVSMNKHVLSRPVVRIDDEYIDLSKDKTLKIKSVLL